MKKKISIILILLLVAVCILAGCKKNSDKTTEQDNSSTQSTDVVGLRFTSNNDGTCYISGLESNLNTEITIPDLSPSGDKVIRIGNSTVGNTAFSGCYKLKSIIIPDSVTSIDDWAFSFCSSLETVTFRENSQLTYIGDHAFYDCSSLKSITIPDGVTTIADWAFFRGSSLKSVTFGENSQLKNIGSHAFYDCAFLKNIAIPDSVKSIGDRAFYWCSALTNITFGENSQLVSIGNHAFWNCAALSNLIIPSKVTSIGNEAFYNCTSLTNIVIPDHVTSIGDSAFSSCTSLKNVTISDSVTDIGADAFKNCISLQYTSYDNVNYLGNTNNPYVALIAAANTSITSCNLHPDIRVIANSAFSGCTSLYRVINHSNLNLTIESKNNGSAAEYAKILIDKAGNITYKDDGYQYIVTEADLLFQKKDGDYTLIAYLGTEETVILPLTVEGNSYSIYKMRGVRKVIIPAGFASIEAYAFSGCTSLGAITIPDSVTSIKDFAFSECISLSSIVYQGTRAQWNGISKGNSWSSNTGEYTISTQTE